MTISRIELCGGVLGKLPQEITTTTLREMRARWFETCVSVPRFPTLGMKAVSKLYGTDLKNPEEYLITFDLMICSTFMN